MHIYPFFSIGANLSTGEDFLNFIWIKCQPWRGETRSGGRGRGLHNARVYYDIISLASHEWRSDRHERERLQEFWADSGPGAWRLLSDGTIHAGQWWHNNISYFRVRSYLSVAAITMCCIIRLLSATWGLSFSASDWSLQVSSKPSDWLMVSEVVVTDY